MCLTKLAMPMKYIQINQERLDKLKKNHFQITTAGKTGFLMLFKRQLNEIFLIALIYFDRCTIFSPAQFKPIINFKIRCVGRYWA